MKMESTDLNSSNEFHYIRPTATKAMMAKEDPLRPYCASNQGKYGRRGFFYNGSTAEPRHTA